MRELKAYISEASVNEVVEALRSAGFLSMSIAHVKYTQKKDIHILGPHAGLPVTHSEMAKLEIVCNKENVQEVVKILSEHGETGDGTIYVSEVQQMFKVRTGKEGRQDLF
ncbi:P-II family nitrogen regulator [Pontibacter sp. 172403-2]|uniref:P-II family nitrogen regulator n=1 Tax=Pontibacter rufus TaxID=2791028 RepID=UPI0018B00031|nr:P-II family nitrogen regulator [Pontibacter sp. 172403-2]MBF9252190.1 P-II family nitrogen regulator [Pontibacter sp. 172403-2]